MKKLKQLLAAMLSVAIVVPMYAMNVSAAGEVYINSTNFPDANFREKVSDECDTNGDGMLSTSEINAVTGLRVYNLGISDLTGINYFTNLTALECSFNNLTSLDVSNLTNLIYLACSENNLTSLDVSGCTSLEALWCNNNNLTSLDISGYTSLWHLDCSSNNLTSLDVSNLTNLRILKCSNNNLTSLDVSGYTSLWHLDCSSNNLTSLDVSNLTNLRILKCSNNNLTSLDVSGCTSLAIFYSYWAYSNVITNLVLTGINTTIEATLLS